MIHRHRFNSNWAMNTEIPKRLRCVELFKELGNAGVVSLKCQHYYNLDRPHGALGGKMQIGRLIKLADKTVLWKEISVMLDPTKERRQEQSYRAELAFRKLK